MNAVGMVALEVSVAASAVAVGVVGTGGGHGQHDGNNDGNVTMPTPRARHNKALEAARGVRWRQCQRHG